MNFGVRNLKADNKKIIAIKDTRLLTLSLQKKAKSEIELYLNSSEELIKIENSQSKLAEISINQVDFMYGDVKDILKYTPTIKNSELKQHMNKYLKNDNENWMIEGFKNQKSNEYCPYCGQKIESQETKKFIKYLSDYINTKTREKVEKLQKELELMVAKLNMDSIINAKNVFFEVIEDEELMKLFTKTTSKKIMLDKMIYTDFDERLNDLRNKFWEKINNIYANVELNDSDKNLRLI